MLFRSSPAARAGLEQGDVIVTLDGRAIGSGGDLQEIVATHAQGDQVSVGYFRKGDRRTADVRLGEAPRMGGGHGRATSTREQVPASAKLGLTLTDLDARAAQELGWKSAGGVVVSEVDAAGPAAMRGVAEGMKVLKVEGQAVKDAAQAMRLIDKVQTGQVISLVVGTPEGTERIVNIRAR